MDIINGPNVSIVPRGQPWTTVDNNHVSSRPVWETWLIVLLPWSCIKEGQEYCTDNDTAGGYRWDSWNKQTNKQMKLSSSHAFRTRLHSISPIVSLLCWYTCRSDAAQFLVSDLMTHTLFVVRIWRKSSEVTVQSFFQIYFSWRITRVKLGARAPGARELRAKFSWNYVELEHRISRSQSWLWLN